MEFWVTLTAHAGGGLVVWGVPWSLGRHYQFSDLVWE